MLRVLVLLIVADITTDTLVEADIMGYCLKVARNRIEAKQQAVLI